MFSTHAPYEVEHLFYKLQKKKLPDLVSNLEGNYTMINDNSVHWCRVQTTILVSSFSDTSLPKVHCHARFSRTRIVFV